MEWLARKATKETMNPVEALVSDVMADRPVQEAPDIPGPTCTCEEVLQCKFSSWYPKFSNLEGRKRKNVTISSVIIQDLPSNFEKYLLSDGVKLPLGAEKLSSCVDGNGDWSSDDESQASDQPDDEVMFSFPDLNDKIKESIDTLNGSVVPKLSWSAPKDASWVNGGSLKCSTTGDIYLLLKSSDFCLHDVLREAWKEGSDYDENPNPPTMELVLRKWCNLHPSMEFRCFVRRNDFLAISQRNHTQHYAHLSQDQMQIMDTLLDFFEDNVRGVFADGKVENYVFDVYIDKKNRVWILDFNVWAASTDSLLFEWSELQSLDMEDEPYFRLVETANQVRQDPLASYRAPIDTVELASLTQGDAKVFEEFMKKCQKPETDESSFCDNDDQ